MAMPAVLALQGSAKYIGGRVHMRPCHSVVTGRYAPSSREGSNLAIMVGLNDNDGFVDLVRVLRGRGRSICAIAADLGVNRSRVERALKAADRRPDADAKSYVG
jgi:hypothetical protein